MKELKMSKKSWHGRLYESTYDPMRLPDNICAYWWKLLVAIILFIPCWAGHVYNLIAKGSIKAIVTTWHIPAALMCTVMWATEYYPKGHTPQWIQTWGWYPVGIAIGLSVLILGITALAIFGLLAWGIDRLIGKKWKLSNKAKKSNPIWEGLKAWKGKYCSKITWY